MLDGVNTVQQRNVTGQVGPATETGGSLGPRTFFPTLYPAYLATAPHFSIRVFRPQKKKVDRSAAWQ